MSNQERILQSASVSFSHISLVMTARSMFLEESFYQRMYRIRQERWF